MMTPGQQLEFSIPAPPTPRSQRRRVRPARAQWWFARMRAVVANAMESPSGETWMMETHRRVKV